MDDTAHLLASKANAERLEQSVAELTQRAYRARRRRWAWTIGRPYSGDLGKPEPAVHDGEDPELG